MNKKIGTKWKIYNKHNIRKIKKKNVKYAK